MIPNNVTCIIQIDIIFQNVNKNKQSFTLGPIEWNEGSTNRQRFCWKNLTCAILIVHKHISTPNVTKVIFSQHISQCYIGKSIRHDFVKMHCNQTSIDNQWTFVDSRNLQLTTNLKLFLKIDYINCTIDGISYLMYHKLHQKDMYVLVICI